MARNAEAEAWVANYIRLHNGGVKCSTCANPEATKAVQDILKAMVKLQKPNISIRRIFSRVKELVPSYDTKHPQSMHSHLVKCESELWNKAKGVK